MTTPPSALAKINPCDQTKRDRALCCSQRLCLLLISLSPPSFPTPPPLLKIRGDFLLLLGFGGCDPSRSELPNRPQTANLQLGRSAGIQKAKSCKFSREVWRPRSASSHIIIIIWITPFVILIVLVTQCCPSQHSVAKSIGLLFVSLFSVSDRL